MEFFHNRAADTAADARRHFDKATVHAASFNVTQSGDTILRSVDSHVCVTRILGVHCFENAAGGREKSCTAVFIVIHFRLQFNILRLEPICQLVKGQNGINNALVILSFILLGNARSDKYSLCIRDSLFDILAMCLHGRKYIGKIRKLRRKIFLYKKIYGMAAGRDDYIGALLPYHSLIFIFNYGCADGCFLDVIEAELLERLTHCTDTHALIVGYERRSKADNNGIAALQKHLDFFCFVNDLLSVLRTDYKALAAHYALVADNICLIPGKPNGFDRTVTNTLVTILTVGFFQSQTFHSFNSFPRLFC